MTSYQVIIQERQASFFYDFDGEPQINLTFEHQGTVYRVIDRAHDLGEPTPTLHAQII